MTQPVREALRDAAQRLAPVSDSARLDAELLMAHALGLERETMLLDRLDDPAPESFAALVDRRAGHEPLAYITGRREFWSLDIEVGPGVLVPRPDSETLIEAAKTHFGTGAPARIVDLGTGSGALLLAALDQWPDATGLGIDRSETALSYARRNAERLGLADRARFEAADWSDGIGGRFDLVLANPPYIETDADLPPDVARFEPGEALFAGADGLDAYRVLAPIIAGILAPNGVAAVEIGSSQALAVTALFTAQGLDSRGFRDLAGRDRCLLLSH